MIPQRVYLKGFLSYRDEQVVLFDGSSLWMMAGLNGSGKSSVFDAITYALFGHHRAGSKDAVELINHQSDRAVVELDFLLDDQPYQARRTISRTASGGKSGTQQLYRVLDDGKKEAVLGTNLKTGFTTWIKENIGLNYETFTSSVLLLQGKAEKLLDSNPAGRFEVLAGIVDLQRFRKLHEKADSRRKTLKASIDATQHQIEGMPEIGELEIKEVEGRIEQAKHDLESAEKTVEEIKEIEQQAQAWEKAKGKHESLENRWKQSQELLSEAEKIENDFTRLQELNQVLAPIQRVFEKQNQIRQSHKQEEHLKSEEQRLNQTSQQQTDELSRLRQKVEQLRQRLSDAENKQEKASDRLNELAGVMSTVKLCEEHRETIQKQTAELDAFQDEPESLVATLRSEIETLSELSHTLPRLKRFRQCREKLQLAIDSALSSSESEAKIRESGAKIREEHNKLKEELESATITRERAEQEAAVSKELLKQAKVELSSFSEMEGARVCRQCGQTLTESHFEVEMAKRSEELEKAQATFQRTDQAQKEARQKQKQLEERFSTCTENLEKAREEFVNAKSGAEQAEKDAQRLVSECAESARELDAEWGLPLDSRDAEVWLATKKPTMKDVEDVQKKCDALADLRQKVKQAEERAQKWRNLKSQLDSTKKSLASLEASLPGNIDELRREHVSLESEVATLKSQVKAFRQEERTTKRELDDLAQQNAETKEQLTSVRGKLQTEEQSRKLCEESIESTRNQLPERWRDQIEKIDLSMLHQWGAEQDKLVRAHTEERAKELETARAQMQSLKAQLEELATEIQTFPESAKVSPSVLQSRMTEAKQKQQTCREMLNEAEQSRIFMEKQRELRRSLEERLLEEQREHNRFHLLSQLLGRDRLQRHLVRRAERQVVDHANALLERLSGGQLYLRLRGTDETSSDKALELEAYNRTTAEAPINVSFLSGSQRFRVAVSLALGLGQYASRQHRPIESVIIDEGFGCLDRQGRQVMISELQNLRGQLRCILLVSHQEEFADAFSDGYHFELEDGATRVTRFQR